MYRDGYGVDINTKIAFINFQKASNMNNYQAKCELAKMYIQGSGVSKNFQEAKRILQVAYQDNYKQAKEIWKEYNLNKLDNEE